MVRLSPHDIYWKKGDRVVADFTRRPGMMPGNEFIPYYCWVAGMKTGHIGTVVKTKRNSLGRVSYVVGFGYTRQKMDFENLKNPGEPYRSPPSIGTFSGEVFA